MKIIVDVVWRTITSQIWGLVMVMMILTIQVMCLDGSNVCMVQQKYNITKRIKYRAPMAVRTYEWCFNMPPRCSRWTTEMRDLTKLETEERVAEIAVCCPGYKMTDVECVPICPNGKTGLGCSQDCPPNKWGPNCAQVCADCGDHASCSPVTGKCECQDGWQGERCEKQITTTSKPSTTTTREELLTNTKTLNKPFLVITINPGAATTKDPIKTTTKIITTKPYTTDTPITLPATQSIKVTTASVSNKVDNKSTILTVIQTSTEHIMRTTKKPIVGTVRTTVTTVPSTEKVKLLHEFYDRTSSNTTILHKSISKIGYINSTNEGKETQKSPNDVATTENYQTNSTLLTSSAKTTRTGTKNIVKQDNTSSTKMPPTTIKFKQKEIWIKPAQKGDSTIVEAKVKTGNEKNRSTKNESALTTPKTIIVSIIPTSVTHTSFKKIALTTASYSTTKHNATKFFNSSLGLTQPMSVYTSTFKPITTKSMKTNMSENKVFRTTPKHSIDIHKIHTNQEKVLNDSSPVATSTNSMNVKNSTNRNSTSNILTTEKTTTTNLGTTRKPIIVKILTELYTTPTQKIKPITKNIRDDTKDKGKGTTKSINITFTPHLNKTDYTQTREVTKKVFNKESSILTKRNLTDTNNTKTNTVTERPDTEETFHVLTEPEHITAVMGDKNSDRSTIDLISVVSIAGGLMMAVITVAIVIVMIERCKRPRYEDVRKINDIHMQVMIDNNDVPPPYVRSIFHSPLPDPPTMEKCHYQPLSTLDRNLQQFMRPVVVKTHISPIMLENFRDILECHYDHLPRRSNFETLPTRIVPSMNTKDELQPKRASSVVDSAIESLKREARLDVIDSTTSEPLYAEIPCWRPPSEHAVEIMTVNGEAVTEL